MQAQQKLYAANHINSLGPPVHLGVIGPQYNKIFQSQIAMLNHSIESSMFIKNSLLWGIAQNIFHRDLSFDIYYPVLLSVFFNIHLFAPFMWF